MRWLWTLLLTTALTLPMAPQRAVAATPTLQFAQPPARWNPLTATEAELHRYNFPPRPTSPAQYERWAELVTKNRWVTPGLTGVRTRTRAGANPIGGTDPQGPSHMPTLNWGGILSLGHYTAVSGRWRQPFAYAELGNRPAVATQWVGLGGHGPGVPLIQMGTEARVNPDGSGSYDAWYEIVGTSADTDGARTLRFPHMQGDEIHAEIWWTEEGGVGTAHFYIADTTLGTATSFSIPDIKEYAGALDSAEWINEVPTMRQGAAYLSLPYYTGAESGRVTFSEARAGQIGDLRYPDPNLRSTSYVTTHRGDQVLQSVSTLSETGDFQTLWLGY